MARFINMGTRKSLSFPSDTLKELKINSLKEESHILKDALETQGYLYIREAIPEECVHSAKAQVIRYMNEQSSTERHIFRDTSIGELDSRCGRGCVPVMEGINSITNHKEVRSVIEHQNLYEIFSKLFGVPAKTFDFKWLRAMYREGFTGAHVDSVYMQRGTQKTLTCWIPFDDIPVEIGGLAICESSHRQSGFSRLHETYSLVDLESEEIEGSGWFTEDPMEITQRFHGEWKTSDFKAGDILIFTLRTVHMSLNNQTSLARISCDTRWYPTGEKPDERYVDSQSKDTPSLKYGINVLNVDENALTIEKLKRKWNFL